MDEWLRKRKRHKVCWWFAGDLVLFICFLQSGKPPNIPLVNKDACFISNLDTITCYQKPVYLWNVPNRCYGMIPQLSQSLTTKELFGTRYIRQRDRKQCLLFIHSIKNLAKIYSGSSPLKKDCFMFLPWYSQRFKA